MSNPGNAAHAVAVDKVLNNNVVISIDDSGRERVLSDLYQAVHHELVASASATKIARELAPNAQIGCMVLSMPVYPLTPNPDDVFASLTTERTNLAFGDIHVRGEYPGYYLR